MQKQGDIINCSLDVFFPPICNGNRTEWSPIRSVIIRVIIKFNDRVAGVRIFCLRV